MNRSGNGEAISEVAEPAMLCVSLNRLRFNHTLFIAHQNLASSPYASRSVGPAHYVSVPLALLVSSRYDESEWHKLPELVRQSRLVMH